MQFDFSNLTEQDLSELNDAIRRTAPKVRFWYFLQSAFGFKIKEREVVEQTAPVSDFDKNSSENPFMSDNEYTTRKFHAAPIQYRRTRLREFLGLRN
jgi:hypothetical protein